MNLQQLLISYFDELDDDLKEVISEVYALERQKSDELKPRLIAPIKDIIDRVSDFELLKKGEG